MSNLDVKRQKANRLRVGFFCLVCIFCISFWGCGSKPEIAASTPLQTELKQKIEDLKTENFSAERSLQTGGSDTKLAETNKAAVITAFPIAAAVENKSEILEYPPQVIPVSLKNEPSSTAEGLTSEEIAVSTEDRLSSETSVNLPVLDKPGMADELISVNFDQVDIRMMLKTIGDITGINFVVDDSVKGTVTVMSPTKIRLGEVYKVLESVLEVKGYAAVPAGDLVKIMPKAEAAKRNVEVRIGSNPSDIPRSDSLVTQIIPLHYADATEVSQIIRPLLAVSSHMATYPRTNSLLITDTSSNIHHIARIIQQLDSASSKEQLSVFELKYASAGVISEQVMQIIRKGGTDSSQPVNSARILRTETGMKILPDTRTNSIIVVANAQDTARIRRLLTELDVQRPSRANNVHVVYLKNAPAKETAGSLTSAVANLRIVGALEDTQHTQIAADEGTNALIITASAQDYEVIAGIVEKLDIVREQVLVEMLIMEVSEDGLKEIGIDWATLDQAVAGSVRFFGATNFGLRSGFVSGDLEGLSVGAWKRSGTSSTIGPILHALEKISGVNILSTPHILTSNHHKAKIIVGENRPFVTQSRITETTDLITPTVIKTFEYKDVGISLEITPHISQGGLVRLEIDSEFTKLIEDVTSPSTDTPTTAKRQAQTVVSMNSGSTVVIGGLIRDDKVTVEKKIPLVSDIPLIGGLFRYEKDRLQKTNLLIFITPYVLGGQRDLEQITEEKRKEMGPALEELEKKTNGDGK
jgi:general secretion pathway protein D